MTYEKIFDELNGNQDGLRERFCRLLILLPVKETMKRALEKDIDLNITTINNFSKFKKKIDGNSAKKIFIWVERKEKEIV